MMPTSYKPMLATLIDAPFDDKGWVFETKWDGFRMIAEIQKGKVRLFSRNGTDVTERYAPIARALRSVRHDAVIDGELAAFDKRGVSRFQLLQNALRTKAKLRYNVFDLLFLDGKDLRKSPLIWRKETLKGIVPTHTLLAYSEHRWERGKKYFTEAQKRREEGIIAKRAAGLYYSGTRTREWLKIKTGNQQEVVIVGYTAPRRSRKYFGALVLAVRDGKRWRYIGRVGTGFTHALLKDIYQKLRSLRTHTKPFANRVPDEAATTWVKPKLVGEIKFTEWTKGGELRHPSFMGLRDDKKPQDVVRETPK